MKQLYLLGFIRRGTDLPSEAPLWTELTTVGEHGVIWCKTPNEMFNTKQNFLWAMVQWFERIRKLELTVLPIQSGVSVSNEVHLVELLHTYEKELEQCFAKVNGCSEYCLTIVHKRQESTQLSNSCLKEKAQSGKEYLERLRVKHELLKRDVLKVQELVGVLCSGLTPWLKDSWFEIPRHGGIINMSFLVPNPFKKRFIDQLQALLDNPDWTIDWTGPWPPFHFSSLSLKPERYLRYESLQWVEKGVTS